VQEDIDFSLNGDMRLECFLGVDPSDALQLAQARGFFSLPQLVFLAQTGATHALTQII
jgi:hypothetical protein